MTRTTVALLTALVAAPLLVPTAADAGSHVRGYYRKNGTHVAPHYRRAPGSGAVRSHTPRTYRRTPTPSYTPRYHNGKVKRSSSAKAAFRRSHPCPSTGRSSGACRGYEVDHVTPLACGGSDAASNMQWLTMSENRLKGAAGCRR